MGIDTKANARAAAHSRLVIFVSLRMAASAEAPFSPILFHRRLRARGGTEMVGGQVCQRALTRKRTLSWRAAHLSEVTALPLSPSHSLVMPSAL